jgi:trk system potassium uptake protein TrkH
VFSRLSAPQLIVLAFAGVVVLGTFLLKWSLSTTGELPWIDAFFLSVSSVCVTGLSPVNVSEALTPFGQGVLALLVQVGGLGIMTAATVGALLVRSKLGFRHLLTVREELGSPDAPRNVLRLIGQVALVTVAVELAGAILIAVRFATDGMGILAAVGHGAFHAVTAFCNAGFTTLGNGLYPYAGDWVVVGTFSVLIVAGGLGFPVLVNLYHYPTDHHLTLHAKLVLVTSAVLLVVGVVSFAALEWSNPASLGREGLSDRLALSVFQGVTPRTAGFQTVDYEALRDPTLLIQGLLMFIGTAPVSTGGGIKVTTVALVFLLIVVQVRGEEDVSAYGRRIPRRLVSEALVLLSLAVVLVVVASIALMVSDGLRLLPALFEVVSAFGTVGLSLNVTPELSAFGKILIAAVMFAGRVGTVTLILALGERNKPRRYKYPEEEIAIG